MEIFTAIFFTFLFVILIILIIYNIIYDRRNHMKIKISFDAFMHDYVIHPEKWMLGVDSVYFLFNDETIEYYFSFFDTIKYHRFYRKKKKIEDNKKKEEALNKLYKEINGDIKIEEKEEV